MTIEYRQRHLYNRSGSQFFAVSKTPVYTDYVGEYHPTIDLESETDSGNSVSEHDPLVVHYLMADRSLAHGTHVPTVLGLLFNRYKDLGPITHSSSLSSNSRPLVERAIKAGLILPDRDPSEWQENNLGYNPEWPSSYVHGRGVADVSYLMDTTQPVSKDELKDARLWVRNAIRRSRKV
jgi:hypothetical protein